MYDFTYENQETGTYIVYTFDEQDEIDTLSLGMLTNNDIPGLAKAIFTQMNESKQVKYDISAKVSMRQLFSGIVTREKILKIFQGIVDAMLAAEDYMIRLSGILLDFDYVFADVTTYDPVLLCVPVIRKESENVEIGKFFKEVIFSVQYDQAENCDYVTVLINYFNSHPIFSLCEFQKVLQGLRYPETQNAQSKTEVSSQVVQSTDDSTKKQAIGRRMPDAEPDERQSEMPRQNTGHQMNSGPQVQPQSLQTKEPQEQQERSMQSGMAIPGKKTREDAPKAKDQNVVQDEKKMTMFYLLQHYSKENAAVYKAQKYAEKNQKAGGKSQKEKKRKAVESRKNMQEWQPDYRVPGAPVNDTKSDVTRTQPAVQPNQVQQSMTQPPISNSMYERKSVGQDFGKTTVLNASGTGKTSVLNASEVAKTVSPYLIRRKNGEKILINKPIFRIGKEKSYVDYFVNDNAAISRSHANIVSHEDGYYIVDTNSTNHTYVDGVMIQSNEEKKLSHGMKLRLANEEFEFRMF